MKMVLQFRVSRNFTYKLVGSPREKPPAHHYIGLPANDAAQRMAKSVYALHVALQLLLVPQCTLYSNGCGVTHWSRHCWTWVADVRSFVHAGLPDRGMGFGNPMVLEDAAFEGVAEMVFT